MLLASLLVDLLTFSKLVTHGLDLVLEVWWLLETELERVIDISLLVLLHGKRGPEICVSRHQVSDFFWRKPF